MQLKVVVIGTGFGATFVAPAYKAIGCEVEVVSPRDAAAVERAVAAPCDLVSIHSPPFLHLEHVRLAAAHKRDILCEKPFGRSAAEAQQMLDIAVDTGVLHFLNFEFRRDTLRQKMKELLDAGAIGEPRHLADSSYMSMGYTAEHGWLFEQDKGGGWIGALASHEVDMLHWLFGDVAEVSCLPRIDVRERPDAGSGAMCAATAEDGLSAWLKMKNGVSASIETTCAAPVDLPGQINLFGSEAVLQLQQHSKLVLYKPGREPETVLVSEAPHPLQGAQQSWLEEVGRAIAAREQIAPDFNSGLACARVLDALRAGGARKLTPAD